MPSLKMKTKSSTGAVKEKYGLHVCLKSTAISKHSYSEVKISQQTAEFDAYSENCHDVSSSMGVSTLCFNCDEAIEQRELVDEENSQVQPSIFFDCTTVGIMGSSDICSSNVETIFSPVLEPVEVFSEPTIICDADGNADASTESNPFPDYDCAEPNMLFDVADKYMVLPFPEEFAKSDNSNDDKSHEVAATGPDNGSFYLEINQMKSFNQDSDVNANSDQADHFDPQLIKYLMELSDVSNFPPTALPNETQRRKSVTLVLDLDGFQAASE